jgi:hypothetical protein
MAGVINANGAGRMQAVSAPRITMTAGSKRWEDFIGFS